MDIYILHILTSCQGQLLQMKFAHSFSLSNKEKLDLWEEHLADNLQMLFHLCRGCPV